MKPFSLLIKPASADCNLRCSYCFYLDRAELYPGTKVHRMSDAVLERMAASYMDTPQAVHAFGWQGGEPTLMGLDFFQRVTEIQQRYGGPGARVANGLQTNGTLIDDELAAHLARYNFLVGISLDGPPELHDIYRRDGADRGSHDRVRRGLDCLKRHKVEHNALTLVSRANVSHPVEVYEYLCDLGLLFHQYIPCVEFDTAGGPLPFTVRPQEWGDFLCAVYDRWHRDDTRRVSIRLFDSILTMMVEGTYNVCHMGGNCRQYFVVEYNGDVYPCDFFVEAKRRLGNVMQDSWEELLASADYREFGSLKAGWHETCSICPHLRFCSGDCLKHRFYGDADPGRLSWLCAGWKQFFEHALPGLRRIAAEISAERGAQPPGDPGRNEPCFCGSGRKFKRCHGGA